MRQAVRSDPLGHRLNIDALAVNVEHVAAEDRILADDRHCGDEFLERLPIRLAIVIHEPKMRAGQRQSGEHADVKAARAASVLLGTNHVKGRVPTGYFRGEQLARRLIGSIVDDYEVFRGICLGVDRSKTSLE